MQAKLELARDLVADLERIDAQRREVKRRTARAVAAAHTTITDVYGVGPIIAATVLGYVRHIRRFPTRDRFASYNGTAPIEVSSGDRKIYRLSRRGNRRLNHAIHIAAISQIRHRGTEGMGGRAALRALKRKISVSSVAGSHPDRPDIRTSHSRAKANSRTAATGSVLRSGPAPDRRRTSRSAAGVQVEPRPGPRPPRARRTASKAGGAVPATNTIGSRT
jgi:transposase